MITETKICGWCFIEKPISEFHKRKKNGKVSLRLECKICYRVKRMKTYHENKIENKEKMRLNRMKYVEKRRVYDRNREVEMKSILKERRAIRYKLYAEIIKQRRKEYYYKNREKVIKLNSAYIEKNKSKVRANQRLNHAKKKKENIAYSILKVLRTRVGSAIKRKGAKCNKTMNLVGCTMPELLKHLEVKFTPEMNWNNYGFYGWHIDHIIPCSKFDMSKQEEQKRCFNYTNLQPLWWIDNFKKGSQYEYLAK